MEALRALGTIGKIAAWTLNKMYGPKHWVKMAVKATTPLDGAIIGEGAESAGDVVVNAAGDEYDDRRRGIDGDGTGFRRGISDIVDPIADRIP